MGDSLSGTAMVSGTENLGREQISNDLTHGKGGPFSAAGREFGV